MKNFTRIIAGLAFAAALISCNKAEYVSKSFVRFNGATVAVKENAGTIKIPVYAYTNNGKTAFPRTENAVTTVKFEVVPGSAEAGKHFNIVPANGQLSFNGNSEAYIEIQIINLAGEYTGDLKFGLKITGASDGYTIGGANTMEVTISDNDHPLANILGTYDSGVLVDNWGDQYVITTKIEAVAGSVTEVTISNLCPYSAQVGYTHTFTATVSEDHKTLSVPTQQWIVKNGLIFLSFNLVGGNLQTTPALVFNVDEANGTLTIAEPQAWGAQTASGWYDLLFAPAVFTKK